MISKIFYWIPRILTIVALLFMTMFSLDVFGGNDTFGAQIIGFLMHNIPVLILLVILIIAWKWEIAGGVLFIVASLAGAYFYHAFTGNPWSLVVIGPFFLTGILFIIQGLVYREAKS